MTKPHRDGTNGQYNDEYDENAFEKMRSKHCVPRKINYDEWEATPNIANLPSSCDDEMFDDYIVTTVDLTMVRNAAANALSALVSKTYDSSVDVTEDNCLKRLECTAQQYDWGKRGSSALVARLKAAQHDGNFVIDEKAPYAELWIGTHPNGMSHIILESEEKSSEDERQCMPLVEYVQQNPEMHLGVVGKVGPSDDYDLTFLFKVLSIEKVLSIQAHPDKQLAAQLFTDKPHAYKDPNHKPEMAVALTDDFEAMCGFRPMLDIASNMLEYPEFTDLIGNSRHDILEFVANKRGVNPKQILKKMFRVYMTADAEHVKTNLENLKNRLAEKDNLSDLDKLIMKLSDQFPGDPGIFAPIIFNYMKLKTGDAFYIGANEPHAYIQGDILECMACSDNVVRAGLTPKLKDVDTLVKMLTYKCSIPTITRGLRKDHCCTLYVPPIEDFAMEIIEVRPGNSYELHDVRSPSVLLTLDGSGVLKQSWVQTMPVSFGMAAFMSANTTAIVIADKNGPGLKIARALSNVHLNSRPNTPF
eukprot:CAMPEP_0176480884 /NCGR_PEP_ID=MMETSP0200_2-20121128/2518_1 /TAXON_ID=947934 /ORGANISM="Chaetoceros sp., Strain GSL56" /LENGTH=529 /DNA_ID=CAMNT_0017877039 /DNA_START=413 /DNA_END=2002 /DNA_ORIENTATION=+